MGFQRVRHDSCIQRKVVTGASGMCRMSRCGNNMVGGVKIANYLIDVR